METVHIANWNEFVALSTECDGWAFRGLQDVDWPLLSSLSRYLQNYVPDKSSWRLREERAFRIFRRKAHSYLPDASVLDDDIRCLALDSPQLWIGEPDQMDRRLVALHFL